MSRRAGARAPCVRRVCVSFVCLFGAGRDRASRGHRAARSLLRGGGGVLAGGRELPDAVLGLDRFAERRLVEEFLAADRDGERRAAVCDLDVACEGEKEGKSDLERTQRETPSSSSSRQVRFLSRRRRRRRRSLGLWSGFVFSLVSRRARGRARPRPQAG